MFLTQIMIISDIDLPLDRLIEFRSIVINVSCVIEKIMNIIQKSI